MTRLWRTTLVGLFIGMIPCIIATGNRTFTIDFDRNTFLKDGEPFRYVSGCMHYFRVPQVYWRDRLEKMKAGGLDAVETYIPWNFHWADGSYIFHGQRDITAFLDLVQDVGLLAIIRGFPYSDTEWDMGGLPSWLLKSEFHPIALRTADGNFMAAVRDWLDVILPMIRPHLYNNGGPVIMVQVENEYGSYYAQDNTYLKSLLIDIDSRLDKNVILFTTDGDQASDLEHGGVKGAFQTVDFGPGTNVPAAFMLLRKYQPEGPLVNSEFYTGWLDHWGEKHHHRTSSQQICATFDEMLASGASVNFYMYTGGTNFGYWSGSNGPPVSQITTSYDYDSPISENGDTTEKYFRIREVIAKYKELSVMSVPPNISTVAYGQIDLMNRGSLWDHLQSLSPNGPISNPLPLSFEDLDVLGGDVLYTAVVPSLGFGDRGWLTLNIENSVRDYATIFVNRTYIGHMTRDQHSIQLGLYGEGDHINILVESRGRICFGSDINDSKGISGKVTITDDLFRTVDLTGWNMFPLVLEKVDYTIPLPATPSEVLATLTIFAGRFYLPEVADTFIDFSGGNWTSGYAIVNGFNLGKFSPKQGPQQTLYMPTKSLLKDEPILDIVIVETSPAKVCATSGRNCPINMVARPKLG